MSSQPFTAGDQGWWPVALSTEIKPDTLYAAAVDDREYVLTRDEAGNVRALEDRCAHRRAPLSLGYALGDGIIQCPYHGWTYDGRDGRCIAIPNLSDAERVPSRYRVDAFETVERDGIVRLRTGGKAKAPPVALLDAMPGTESVGSMLLARPFEDVARLLLNAPGLLLDLGRAIILDRHRLGVARQRGDSMTTTFAVDWRRVERRLREPPSDFPLALAIDVNAAAGDATIRLEAADGNILLVSRLAWAPRRNGVSALYWRSVTALQQEARQRASFAVRKQIDPQALTALVIAVDAGTAQAIDLPESYATMEKTA